MIYVLAPNEVVKKYPYTPTDLRFDNPSISFSVDITIQTLNAFDVFEVVETPKPSFDPIKQNIDWANPVKIDGVWMQQWTISEATPSEIKERETQAMQSNKSQAESLLQATDWVEYASVRDVNRTPHLVNGDAFDDYRVALRGIAVNPPITVDVWPVKPDEEWSN
jgi:hypothetical protein